jgi:hypothetical protein
MEKEPRKELGVDKSKLAPLPPFEDVYDYDEETLELVL